MAGEQAPQTRAVGSLFAVVNLCVLGTVGYYVYKRLSIITEPRVNSRPLAVISCRPVCAGDGLQKCTSIPHRSVPNIRVDVILTSIRGQEEPRHAEEKGHNLYNRSKEVVLRPQVARGLLGAGMSTI